MVTVPFNVGYVLGNLVYSGDFWCIWAEHDKQGWGGNCGVIILDI